MPSDRSDPSSHARRVPSVRRTFVQGAQTAIDVLALSASYLVAFAIRFDGSPTWPFWKMAWLTLPYVVFAKYALLSIFGVPQYAWRYIGMSEALQILKALAVGSFALVAARILAPLAIAVHPAFTFLVIPLGVIAIDAAIGPIGIIGVRTLRRAMIEKSERESRSDSPLVPMRTLIVGAGDEGAALARSLALHPELGVDAVGFVDEDPAKVGSRIHGIRVLGSIQDASSIARRHGIEQAILALPDRPREQLREILGAFDGASIPVKVVPPVSSFVGVDGARLSLRPIELEDLLRRSSVSLADAPVESLIRGRVVLVTGAGGSIGGELARQIAVYGPSTLVVADRSEHALYQIRRELEARDDLRIVARLVDVTNERRVRALFEAHRPAVVFHAAAHKHVPMLEDQVTETIRNNLLGTMQVVDAACATSAEVLVLISTDKAVNPSSVMGASKRAAELYLQLRSQGSRTRLTAVRFGNVLGSSGSVIPLFREQIARGGPLTITHPEMRRYFMTIPEASHLVLHAGALGNGGEVFILDMGEPVRIVDLAEDLIRLSGLVPNRDIRIEFTGLRPGEKLFEELSVDAEKADRTSHPKIFTARVRGEPGSPDDDAFRAILEAAEQLDELRTADLLRSLVPEYVNEHAAGPGATTAR